MKKKDPALWAACRLHRILGHASRHLNAVCISSLPNLLSEQLAVQRCWRLYEKAQSRGWMFSADTFLKRLFSHIDLVHSASRDIHPARVIPRPTVADILSELDQLQDEFDVVEIDAKHKRIDVTTDAITLEDVRLGAFRIRLHFDRLARRRDSSAFVIIAEDENPAAGDSTCTHPHVRNESLCAGEATVPISNALSEGRIGDAIQLINRVLHTYNSGSAYVSLEDWDGRACSDCDNITSSESLSSCNECKGDFCDDCIRTCDRCEQSVCDGCSHVDDNGDRLCPECKRLDDEESEETHEEEQTPVSDDPVHDPTEEEQPQPSTETIHEHSQSPETLPPGIQLPGGTTDGDGETVAFAVPPPLAA
jgi:hypothetical protein